MLITLPSGLAGEVRPLKGLELKQIADPSIVRSGRAHEIMLANCWLQTVDAGPYAWVDPAKKLDWLKILLGDRFAAIVELRTLSLGGTYVFRVQCGAQRCGEMYEWELELGDLPRQPLPESSADVIKAGRNAFTVDGPGGHVIHFALPTGDDERRYAKIKRQQQGAWSAIDSLLHVITGVEGLAAGNIPGVGAEAMSTNRATISRYLEDLSWPELEALQAGIDAQNCGIETDIETRCPYCSWENEIRLPFEEDFFRQRKLKAAAAGAAATTSTSGPPTPPTSGAPAQRPPAAAKAPSTASSATGRRSGGATSSST